MDFVRIYEIGRALPIGFTIEGDQKKLTFMRFRYTSKEVVATALVLVGILFILYYILDMIMPQISMPFLFLGGIGCAIVYVLPIHFGI